MRNEYAARSYRQATLERANAPGHPCVWAMGGGKGGTGKSIISSSLGVALASRGRRCVLIDADFGCANLHTLLGVPTPRYTLSHFLTREVENLGDVMSETQIPNLYLVSGARSLLHMANLKHLQRQRLLKQISQLEIEHVLVDLGAGSAYNAIDFFIEAQRPILSVVPEPTSIENAYHFLKAAFYRTLRKAASRSPVRKAIHQVLEERQRRPLRSPLQLISDVTAIDRDAGRALRERAQSFRPKLIVNQVRQPAHLLLGDEIRDTCRRYLGIEIEPLGALSRDESVHDAVRRRQSVLQLHPGCSFSLELELIVDRLLHGSSPAHGPRYPWRQDRALYDERYFVTHGAAADHDGSARSARSLRQIAESRDAPGISRPGALLKHCRERLGLGLRELSHRTRIRNLESLENEHYGQLPPEPYVRGYVLEYARTLGIRDAEAVASSYVERYRRAAAG